MLKFYPIIEIQLTYDYVRNHYLIRLSAYLNKICILSPPSLRQQYSEKMWKKNPKRQKIKRKAMKCHIVNTQPCLSEL